MDVRGLPALRQGAQREWTRGAARPAPGEPLHPLLKPRLPHSISDLLSVSVASWGRGTATSEPSSGPRGPVTVRLSLASGPFFRF